MHTSKSALRNSRVLASPHPSRALQKPPRTGGISTDARMRSPSPARPRVSFEPDNDHTLISPDDDDDNAKNWTDEEPADDTYFPWEEEATLLSDLLEEATPEASDAKLLALAESLQQPFNDESRQLKKDIARTFVPLMNDIKGIYASIDRTVDIPFGAGLLIANEAYKDMEKSIGAGADVMQKARTEHRKHVTELLQRLEEEYARRDQLWVNFQRAMDDLVNPVLEVLSEAPAKMERTIAAIEKQGKVLDKENANASAEVTSQALKDILSSLK